MPIIKYAGETAEEKVARQKKYNQDYYQRRKEEIKPKARANYVPKDDADKKKAGRPRYVPPVE